MGRVLPGATAYRLLGEAPCAVAVAPLGFGTRVDGGSRRRPRRGSAADVGMGVIGVGFDGSPAARQALELAAELAVRSGAALRVYAVASRDPDVTVEVLGGRQPTDSPDPEKLRGALDQAVAGLPEKARALPVFLRGLPAAELLDAVEHGVDLLVLGSESGGPVRRAFMGSVSTAVLGRAPCPVLISPGGVRKLRPALA